jgi:outer membrane autotransporter protein
MRKLVSYLSATAVAVVLALMPVGAGADWYAEPEYYPSNAVLSHVFPSNDVYEWSIDFSGRLDAATDWMVRTMSTDAGFTGIPGGGFGVTREQAYQAVVGSTNGSAMGAWAEVAYKYADSEYPTGGEKMSRNGLWEKIKFTLDGQYIVPELSASYDYGHQWGVFVHGTPYLYNLNTITGVGFASTTDSAIMNVSGVTNQIIGKRLADVRSANDENSGGFCARNAPNRFWASPFVTVREENDRGGYAPFRYKAVGGALGYDRAFGQFTAGGSAFYSRGRYRDKWSWGDGENEGDHYGLAVYGNWRVIDKLFLDAHAGYQRSDNSIRRELVGSNGDWLGTKNSTGTWWLAAKAGSDFGPWNNFTVTPSIGLEYQRAGSNGFTVSDRLGDPFMRVDGMKRDRFFMPVDLSVQYRLNVCDVFAMTLRAGGGYAHDFSNKGATGTMRYAGMKRQVGIRGGKPKAGGWNMNLGAKVDIRERLEFGVDYRYEGAGNYGYTGTFGVNF